jgi:hypothetical protein
MDRERCASQNHQSFSHSQPRQVLHGLTFEEE